MTQTVDRGVAMRTSFVIAAGAPFVVFYTGLDDAGREAMAAGAALVLMTLAAGVGPTFVRWWFDRRWFVKHLRSVEGGANLRVDKLRELVEILDAEAPELLQAHPDLRTSLLATDEFVMGLLREGRAMAEDLKPQGGVPRYRPAAAS